MNEPLNLEFNTRKSACHEYASLMRVELIRLQGLLRRADLSVVVVLAGNDLLGCNDVLNFLHSWLDPRYLEANAFGEPTDDEKERPLFWRYWRALAPKGRIGVFVRSWIAQSIVQHLEGVIDDAKLGRLIGHMKSFEKTLVDDGVLLVKFWLHLPKSELRKRLKVAGTNRRGAWRVHPQDRRIHDDYKKSRKVVRRILRQTSTPDTPWIVVDSVNSDYRNSCLAQHLISVLSVRLDSGGYVPAGPAAAPNIEVPSPTNYLNAIDLSRSLSKNRYTDALESWQGKLYRLSYKAYDRGVSTVLVFEGWDAAGKGGIIRRLTTAMDAAIYRVIPVSAPSIEESQYNYLWRFWKQIPRAGRIAIFDRSWYGRVLVERVEKFAADHEWRRAFGEINDFEQQLCEHGIMFLKFWIHIDAEEQLRRFQHRENTSFKRHKMSNEDYRNREKWGAYVEAANDMIHSTNTKHSRWRLIAGNDKRSARVDVIKIVCRELKSILQN